MNLCRRFGVCSSPYLDNSWFLLHYGDAGTIYDTSISYSVFNRSRSFCQAARKRCGPVQQLGTTQLLHSRHFFKGNMVIKKGGLKQYEDIIHEFLGKFEIN